MVDRRDVLKGGVGLLGLGGLGAFLARENQQDNLANDRRNDRQGERISGKVDKDDIELQENDNFPVVGYNDPNGVGFDQVRRTLNNTLSPSLRQSESKAQEIDGISEVEELLSSGSEARIGESGVSGPREEFSTSSTGALPDSDGFVRDADYIISKVDDTDILRQNDRGDGVRRQDYTTFGATRGIQTNVAAKDVINEYDLVGSDKDVVNSALSDVEGFNVFARTDPKRDGLVDADPEALRNAKDDVVEERENLVDQYDTLTAGEGGYTTSAGLSRDLGNSLADARHRAEQANKKASKKGVEREFGVKQEETAQDVYDNASGVAQGYQELVNGIAGQIAQLDVIGRTLENGIEVAEEMRSNSGKPVADPSPDSYEDALPPQDSEKGCHYRRDKVISDLDSRGVEPDEISQAFFQSDDSLRVVYAEGDNITYDTC